MAREVTFPRTRHVALSGLEQGGEAKAAGSEAILVPIRVAAQVTPPAGVPLPPPVEPGAPGVPEKGALPAAAPVPALEAGTEAPAPQTRQVPWVIGADVGVPTGDTDPHRALDGAPAAVRSASSLEGPDPAGALAARAAPAGDAGHPPPGRARLRPPLARPVRRVASAACGAGRSRAEAGRRRSSCGGQRGASAALCRAGDGVRRRSVARRRRAAAGAGGS